MTTVRPTDGTGRDEPTGSWRRWLWPAAVAVLAVGILVHGVRAPLLDWVPSGDDGWWAIRARAVFSAHPPLLGSSSSGGLSAGTGFHHLGPLGFYLLAPFVRVLGGVGVAVGAAVLNATAAVLACVAARSGVGRRAGWFVAVATAALVFAMGSELLVDPWNPHLAVMAWWAGLCCTWAVLRGAAVWAPAGVALLSLAIQTHLSFVPLAGAVGLVLVVATVWSCARHDQPAAHQVPAWRRWAPVWSAAVVGLVAWAPVLIEQLLGAGPGNLSALVEGGSGQDQPIGVRSALGALGAVVTPTRWLPGGWSTQVLAMDELAPWWLGGVVLVAAIGAGAWAVLRRAPSAAAAVLAAALVAGGVVVSAAVGVSFPGVPMSQLRWWWPVLCLLGVVLADLVVGELGPLPRAVRAWAPVGGLAVVVALVLATLPSRDEGSGAVPELREPVVQLLDQLEPALESLDRPLVRISDRPLATVAGVAVLDRLDELGVGFALDDEVLVRQAGAEHASDGDERVELVVRGGVEALTPSTEVVLGLVDPLDEAEWERYQKLRDGLDARLAQFVDQLDDDPALRGRVDPPYPHRLDAGLGWTALLCGEHPSLPRGDTDVQARVLGDDERADLCDLERRLDLGAVSVSLRSAAGVGPADGDGFPGAPGGG
jgi:hypothetical protein